MPLWCRNQETEHPGIGMCLTLRPGIWVTANQGRAGTGNSIISEWSDGYCSCEEQTYTGRRSVSSKKTCDCFLSLGKESNFRDSVDH